jgi:hypothetical protein
MGARAEAATEAMRTRMREHVAHHLRVLIEGRVLMAPQGYLSMAASTRSMSS